MTGRSIEKFGPRQPIEVDAHGKIINGNSRQELYVDAGIDDEVVLVDHTPGKIVAIRYPDFDLDDPDNPAREYQIAQARSGVVSFMEDAENIAHHLTNGLQLDDWYFDFELEELMGEMPDMDYLIDPKPTPQHTQDYEMRFRVVIDDLELEQAKDIADKFGGRIEQYKQLKNI